MVWFTKQNNNKNCKLMRKKNSLFEKCQFSRENLFCYLLKSKQTFQFHESLLKNHNLVMKKSYLLRSILHFLSGGLLKANFNSKLRHLKMCLYALYRPYFFKKCIFTMMWCTSHILAAQPLFATRRGKKCILGALLLDQPDENMLLQK